MSPRPFLGLASLIFIGGAVVLLFFVILAGAISANPVNQFYFLQVDTSAISGAPALSRWTLWGVCSVDPNNLNVCPKASAAYPFDPQNNFGTTNGVPSDFIGTNSYYYLTRFLFALILIALFFAVSSLFLGLFALCSRIGSYLSSVTCFLAFFFQTVVAALMTAAYVKGRNEFNNNNQTATLGRFDFGFVWAAMVCLFIATILFCLAGRASKRDPTNRRSGTFGRKKRERGSFIDNESQRAVVNNTNEEYNRTSEVEA